MFYEVDLFFDLSKTSDRRRSPVVLTVGGSRGLYGRKGGGRRSSTVAPSDMGKDVPVLYKGTVGWGV